MNLPSFQDSLAFCPAEITISNGRGAREDQCSCFDTAISAHIPDKDHPANRKLGDAHIFKEIKYCVVIGA